MSDLGNKEVFSKNLNYYMRLYKKDRNRICHDLNLNYSTVRDWTNGRAYPRIDKIELLANYFGIQKSDLIEQKDNIIENVNFSAMLVKEIASLSQSEIEKELLTKCTMLDNKNQNKVLEIVNMYLKDQGDYYEQNKSTKWEDNSN